MIMENSSSSKKDSIEGNAFFYDNFNSQVHPKKSQSVLQSEEKASNPFFENVTKICYLLCQSYLSRRLEKEENFGVERGNRHNFPKRMKCKIFTENYCPLNVQI